MASLINNYFKQKVANGTIDLDTDDIRAVLVDATTTVDTEDDVQLMNAYTTLGELSGTNYVRKALANEAVNIDTANNRAEFDADDVTWTAMGGDNADAVGVLLYKHVTNDTDSIPIAYIEFSSPVTFNGGDFTINWDAQGILQLT